MSFNKGDNTF